MLNSGVLQSGQAVVLIVEAAGMVGVVVVVVVATS